MAEILEKTEDKTKPIKKVREPQFELLRVVAMLMVITLHYLGKGELLGAPAGSRLIEGGVWYLEALSIVSVNIYVMISGYFMIDSKFTLRKLLILWCQVLFYSLLGVAVGLAAGVIPFTELCNLFTIQYYCLPIINQHYWFATSYILLYIFSPLLNAGVKKLDQKQHGILLLLLLLFYSIVKSFLPVTVALEDYGYSLSWFLVLYVLASYIRRYGISFFEKRKLRSLIVYLGSAACIVILGYLLAKYGIRFGEAGDMRARAYRYNFILVVTASVGLFYFFKELQLKDNALTRLIVRIAPYTFGVYLLHEHLLIRYEWCDWLRVKESYGIAGRIGNYVCAVLLIFVLGIFIDFLRARLFDIAERLIVWGWGIYMKNREIFDYLIVGFATTVVSWIALAIFMKMFTNLGETLQVMVANALSWVVSVIFAYVTNRSFVFHSKKSGFIEITKEFFSFTAARLFSFGVDEGLMLLFVSVMHMNVILAKAIDSVVVIILNYILSKLLIFKKPDAKGDETKQEGMGDA